jgi:hypothetical protein
MAAVMFSHYRWHILNAKPGCLGPAAKVYVFKPDGKETFV